MRFIYTKTFAVFAACFVIVCMLAILQIKGWLNPITQAIVHSPRPVASLARGIARPIKGFFSTIYGLRKIADDNTRLTQQVATLQQQVTELDRERRENEALRKELGFAATVKFSLVPCTVVSQNPYGLTGSLVLNCGTAQGVAVGQAVLSQGYLVAKVIYAGKNSSTALLATDSRFSADVELSKTGADGIAAGSFNSGLLLDRLRQIDQVDKGWLVVTAGINELIPKGILVGQVGDVISSDNDLFKKTTLLSPVDFNHLDFVFVAKP